MSREAFFKVHADLPREGPGCRADLEWAFDIAAGAPDARVLDAGCGPGADIAALLAQAPQGNVTAVDPHEPFIEAARQRYADASRVQFVVGNMADVPGPFDFVWSAGALYFLGVEAGLATMAAKLAPGGTIAFSHLVYTVEAPDAEVRAALEPELSDIGSVDALRTRIAAAGFDVLGQRILSEAAWAEYYDPLRARVALLRPGADPDLAAALDETEAEIALYDQFGDQFGYVLHVVRPA